jgi:ubiquinone biosynthesis protein UbiJ
VSGQAGTAGLELLEACLNRLLELDPDSAALLDALAGRVFAFEITGPGIGFVLAPGADGVRVHAPGTVAPDVTVRGRPAALLRHLAGRGGHIEVAGDVELAQRLQQVLARLDPDWEEALAAWVGGSAARNLCRGAAALRDCMRTARASLGASVSEYLRYERRVLVDRPEAETFVGAVDDLRDDVERLRARLQRLDRRLARE